ncbi:beta-lactamase-like protein [Protomyces lactucae-debilis]|uniref:ribonuclease Z n=1 Tax=Protomyces lactucae-debilis TaxID=2754530 RepID=A0A1Y2F335_PROLT|nr:beta-lactamase-like protein [Protomyces lactucae-debilis]ORY78253.1 beta-lactamase-like protein [Protomyces lactucae-debilis]
MPQSFKVVSLPSPGIRAEPVLAVIYDDKRYLFNCGEGTQRQLLSKGLSIKKFTNVFLSSSWDSFGGLAGLLLGLATENGYPQIALHGPQNLAYYLATLRAGLQRFHRYTDGADFQIEEYTQLLPQPFEDANVKIQAILTQPKGFGEIDRPASTSEAELKLMQSVARSVWTGEISGLNAQGDWTALADPNQDTTATQKKRTFEEMQQESSEADRRESFYGRTGLDRDKYTAFIKLMHKDLPTATPFPATVSYCIEGQPRPGKFDVARAMALGVPKGPLYGKLQQGQSVYLPNGTVVHPHEVLGPRRLSAPALIANCPSVDYISTFLKHNYWDDDNFKDTCGIIVHTGDPAVLSDPCYIAWMASFHSGTMHILSHPLLTNERPIIDRSEAHYLSLQSLDADQYPHVKQLVRDDSQVVFARLFGAVADVRPLKGDQSFLLDTSVVDQTKQTSRRSSAHHKIDVDAAQRSKPEVSDALKAYEEAIKRTATTVQSLVNIQAEDFPGCDVEVVTLGTGSAGPSIYRNVAATLIRSPDGLNVLLDCGEGTLNQLHRAFGAQQASEMRKIKMIYISHLHADHHLGLIGVVRQWMQVNARNEDKLVILAPVKLLRSIREYDAMEGLQLHRLCLQSTAELYNSQQTPPNTSTYRQMLEIVPQLDRIETVPAIHSERSTCLRLDHRDGWSVAFSGDTRPSSQFMKLGHGVTCLIHEATFQNSKSDEAIKKKHSTVNEALFVSQEMQAHVTILTHFSQRYPKLPVLEDDESTVLAGRNIVCAHDLMHIKLKHAWKDAYYLKDELALEKCLETLRAQGTLPAEKEDETISNE